MRTHPDLKLIARFWLCILNRDFILIAATYVNSSYFVEGSLRRRRNRGYELFLKVECFGDKMCELSRAVYKI